VKADGVMQRVVFNRAADDLAQTLAVELAGRGQNTVLFRSFLATEMPDAAIEHASITSGMKLGIIEVRSEALILSVTAAREAGYANAVLVIANDNILPRPVGRMALSVQLSRFGRSQQQLLIELLALVELAHEQERAILWLEVLEGDHVTSPV